VLQRVAVCCSVLPCVADGGMEGIRGGETGKAGGGACFAVCCRLSLCCRVFQCIAGGGGMGAEGRAYVQRLTACCSVLQVTLKVRHECYSSCVSLFAFFLMCVRARARAFAGRGNTSFDYAHTHIYTYMYIHTYICGASGRASCSVLQCVASRACCIRICMHASINASMT